MPATGVQFVEPPVAALPGILASIQTAISALPPWTNGAVVGLVNAEGMNAAIVAKGPFGFEVQAWIGKTWSSKTMTYGAQVRKVW